MGFGGLKVLSQARWQREGPGSVKHSVLTGYQYLSS